MTKESNQRSSAARPPVLDCESAMRQLWDYLDGELTPERTAAVRAHLEVCRPCYAHYEFEKAFLSAVAASSPGHSDPERLRMPLMDALRARGLSDT